MSPHLRQLERSLSPEPADVRRQTFRHFHLRNAHREAQPSGGELRERPGLTPGRDARSDA
jgi:hypothetical protein